MASHSHNGNQSQNQSPIASRVVSGQASPANSILLPPVEIEVSPSHSLRSSSSSSASSKRRMSHHSRRSSSDSAKERGHDDNDRYSSQTHDHPSRRTTGNSISSLSQNISFTQKESTLVSKSAVVYYGNEYIEATQSASNISIIAKKHGWFGRLRRSPNFILLTVFLALFVDMASYGIIVPILPFIVSEKVNGGAADTGLLLAVYAVGMLLSSPLFAVLGDHFVSRRIPMLIGLVGMIISSVLFMLTTNFQVFLLARLLQGMASGSVWIMGLALISDVFPAHTLGVQMGKALVGYTLGLMMGPPLGGILYERGGYQAPFLFCCVVTLADFTFRALIIEEREEIVKALRKHGMQNEASEEEAEVIALRRMERLEESTSFWKLIKNKRLLGCIVITACNAFAFSGAEPTIPLHLASTFNMTSTHIGLVFLAFSLPTLTAPISGALSDKFGARVICLVSLVICGSSIAAAGLLQHSLPMIIILFTVIGTTGTAFLTPVLGELSAVARITGTGDSFARAYAMFNMAFSIGVLVGPVVCGIVYENFGFTALSMTMAGVLFMGVPFVVFCLGGSEQKKQDLEKYNEEEARRTNKRQRLNRSKYSIEFTGGMEEEDLGMEFSPGEDELVEKHLSEERETEKGLGLVGMSREVFSDDILKTARLD